MLTILSDLARLSKQRVAEHADLLRHTSLTQLMQTGREIGSRMDFLSGLNTVSLHRQIKSRLLKRRQMHRILAYETWIFGEEWSRTSDDERLTKVLKKFLNKLGKEVELADLKQVQLEEGADGIPSWCCADPCKRTPTRSSTSSSKYSARSTSRVTTTSASSGAYARAIVNDKSFAQPNVKWDFWLVGSETTRTVDKQRRSPTCPTTSRRTPARNRSSSSNERADPRRRASAEVRRELA